jgi:hypothetical protein
VDLDIMYAQFMEMKRRVEPLLPMLEEIFPEWKRRDNERREHARREAEDKARMDAEQAAKDAEDEAAARSAMLSETGEDTSDPNAPKVEGAQLPGSHPPPDAVGRGSPPSPNAATPAQTSSGSPPPPPSQEEEEQQPNPPNRPMADGQLNKSGAQTVPPARIVGGSDSDRPLPGRVDPGPGVTTAAVPAEGTAGRTQSQLQQPKAGEEQKAGNQAPREVKPADSKAGDAKAGDKPTDTKAGDKPREKL